MTHHLRHRPKKRHLLFSVFLPFFFIFITVVFSVIFYTNMDVRSNAMDTTTFKTILAQKGLTLPSPLPSTLTEAQYSQMAQLVSITIPEAKVLYGQLLAEQNPPTPLPTPPPSALPSTPIPKAVYDPTLREGTLSSYISDDFGSQTSSTHYLLTRQERYIEVVPTAELERVTLGTPVRILGTLNAASQLQVSPSVDGASSIQSVGTLTPMATVAPITGAKKIAVLLLNFPNLSATTPTASTVSIQMNGEFKNFELEASYNKLQTTTDVFDWKVADIPATCQLYDITNAAIRAFDSSVNFNNYEYIMIVHPVGSVSIGWNQQECNYAGRSYVGKLDFQTLDGTVNIGAMGINSQYMELRTTAHEMGHAFGARHSNGWNCGTVPDVDPWVSPNPCTSLLYADWWETMGGYKPYHFSGYHKEQFGWLPASSIITATRSGTYVLNPIEIATTQPQVLKVKRDNIGNFYYLETRKAVGFDNSIPTNALNAVLLRYSPKTINSGDTHLVDLTPSNPFDPMSDFLDAPLKIGSVFSQPSSGIGIKPLSKSGDQTTVQVSVLTEMVYKDGPLDAWKYTLDLRPLFTWFPYQLGGVVMPTSYINTYTLQVSDTESFTKILLEATVPSTQPYYQTTTSLPAKKLLFWRVRANDALTSSPWGSSFSFTTPNPPSVPVLVSPANNSRPTVDVPTFKLTWNASSNAPTTYEVAMSATVPAKFNEMTGTDTPGYVRDTIATVSASVRSYAPSTVNIPMRTTSVTWKVRALNALGEYSLWSTPFSFTPFFSAIPSL